MIPTIDKERTGRWLKFLFEFKGLTAKDVKEYLSLACVQTIYRWFKGETIPTVDNLYMLSELLDRPMDNLILGNCPSKTDDHCSREYRFFFYYDNLHPLLQAVSE